MNLKSTLTAFFLFTSLHLMSQSAAKETTKLSLSGTVLDSANRQPIEYATISLFEEGNTKALSGALTDASGKFTLDLPKTGVFDITIESIGYQAFTIHKMAI